MNVAVVGIDIAKRVFQIHGVAANGAIAIRRKLSRDAFLRFFAALPSCRIGLEC